MAILSAYLTYKINTKFKKINGIYLANIPIENNK